VPTPARSERLTRLRQPKLTAQPRHQRPANHPLSDKGSGRQIEPDEEVHGVCLAGSGTVVVS
jgi:hypothetical protein